MIPFCRKCMMRFSQLMLWETSWSESFPSSSCPPPKLQVFWEPCKHKNPDGFGCSCLTGAITVAKLQSVSCELQLVEKEGKEKKLDIRFGYNTVMELEKHESRFGSPGAESRSLHDRHPQSSKFRWIGLYEQDSSEWCNSYSDGTLVIVQK